MYFTYPAFLFALALLSVPLIIHLFNFRKYKKVYFSNVRFLLSIQQETQSINKIRQWLILLSRIFAITCLVFAFAQPVIPGENSTRNSSSKQQISVFVDNSFSMDAQQREGRLVDIARNYAQEISGAYSESEVFQLLTHDFEGRHQVLYSKDEWKNLLNEVALSSQSKKISEVIQRQQDILLKQPENTSKIYILSDFQKSFTDLDKIKLDSTIQVQFIPITPTSQMNLAIDSCWLDSPELQVGKEIKIYARIKNYSDSDIENNVIRLIINGQQKTPAYFSIPAGSSVDVSMNYTIQNQGEHKCIIEIDDAQILFDDKFYFAFDVKSSLNIYGITGDQSTDFFKRIFNSDTYFNYTTVKDGNIDFGSLKNQDVVVLQGLKEISDALIQELKKYSNQGGSIIIVPGNQIDFDSYNRLSSELKVLRWGLPDSTDTRLVEIKSEDPFYADIFESIPKNMDLPYVNNHYQLLSISNSRIYPILTLFNRDIFYARCEVDKGNVFMLAVPLNESWTNFQKNALFVATMIKSTFISTNTSSLFYTIGNNEKVDMFGVQLLKDEVIHVKQSNTKFDYIPEQRMVENKLIVYPSSQINEAGWYELYLGSKKLKTIAYNYPRSESDPNVHSMASLQDQIDKSQVKGISLVSADEKTIKNIIRESEKGTPLWKLFIVLTLFFLLVEVLLIRFMKR